MINVQKFHKPLLYKSKNKIPWRYFINMICIYEPLCEGKGHELVNAGIIELLNIIRPYEKLIFYGEKFHLENNEHLLSKKRINIENREIILPLQDDLCSCIDNLRILSNILLENIKEKNLIIFITVSNIGVCFAVNILSRVFKNVKFIIGMHGIMEHFTKSVLSKQAKLFKKVLELSAYRQNVTYLIYSKLYKKYLKNIFSIRLINKIKFIHMPYLYTGDFKKKNKDKLVLAAIGSAGNKKMYELIKYINMNYCKNNYEFNIFNWGLKIPFSRLRNTNLYLNSDRDKINEVMHSVDCIIIPYDKNQYKISTSGIIFDAISYEVPIFTLDSNCCIEYSKYGIGENFSTVEEMALRLIEIMNLDYHKLINKYSNRAKKLKYTLKKIDLQILSGIVEESNIGGVYEKI